MNISRTHTYDIFLSYRRSDGKLLARLLKESLEKQGLRVFLDMDELVDGVFNERVLQVVESAPIFLLLMTPHVCYRCSQEKDWVRMEIDTGQLYQESVAKLIRERIRPIIKHKRLKKYIKWLPLTF
jgi:hypothetical protein